VGGVFQGRIDTVLYQQDRTPGFSRRQLSRAVLSNGDLLITCNMVLMS
jgi:hypothetical protein